MTTSTSTLIKTVGLTIVLPITAVIIFGNLMGWFDGVDDNFGKIILATLTWGTALAAYLWGGWAARKDDAKYTKWFFYIVSGLLIIMGVFVAIYGPELVWKMLSERIERLRVCTEASWDGKADPLCDSNEGDAVKTADYGWAIGMTVAFLFLIALGAWLKSGLVIVVALAIPFLALGAMQDGWVGKGNPFDYLTSAPRSTLNQPTVAKFDLPASIKLPPCRAGVPMARLVIPGRTEVRWDWDVHAEVERAPHDSETRGAPNGEGRVVNFCSNFFKNLFMPLHWGDA